MYEQKGEGVGEVVVGCNKVVLGDEVDEFVQIERPSDQFPFAVALKDHFREIN